MNIAKIVFVSASLFLSMLLSHAQNSRGVAAAPDFVSNPAEGIYDISGHTVWLYTFSVGRTRANSFSPLLFPDEDCKRVEQNVKSVFQYAYTVNVFSLPDNDYYRVKRTIIDQLTTALNSARAGDIVMLYFSGHGIVASNPYVSTEYYFIPYDINIEDPQASAVSGANIRMYVDELVKKGVLVLVFIDTCHAEAIYPNVEPAGEGAVAYFASSEAGGETVENAKIRSTNFTEAFINLLQGEGSIADLRIRDLALVLESASEGKVPAKIFGSGDIVLLKSFDKKSNYRITSERYNDYIEKGKNALASKDYSRAFFEFEEAHSLERYLDKRDRQDYSSDLSSLNAAVAEVVSEKFDEPGDPEWKSLAMINDRTYFLDRRIVPLSKLYLGCGLHFMGEGDYQNALPYFEKAHSQGNNTMAPYYMARIAETHLPGTYSQKVIYELYEEARQNGYDGENIEAARKDLMRMAEAGDIRSQAILGRCYYIGDTLGIKKDAVKSVKWLTIASDKNDPLAMRWLGHCYRDGVGVDTNYQKAVKLYKESYKKGESISGYYLALMEYEGKGLKKNEKDAIKKIKKMADKGMTQAQEMYGNCLFYGEGVEQNKLEGIKYLTLAAENGEQFAQKVLADIYSYDNDIPHDSTLALYWVNELLKKNSVYGYDMMGVFYDSGTNVNWNDSLAIHYYLLAAEKGYWVSETRLAEIYHGFRYNRRDFLKALYWYKRAIQDGDNHYAPAELVKLYVDLGVYYLGWYENSQIDYPKAFEYLSLADSLGYTNIARLRFLFGYYYESCSNSNINKAIENYNKSIAENDSLWSNAARNNLGLIYWEGPEETRDIEKAKSFFVEAANRENMYAAYNAGILFEQQGDTSRALAFYEKAGEMGYSFAYEQIGNYYYNKAIDTDDLSLWDKAEGYYRQALAINPDMQSCRELAGNCWYFKTIDNYKKKEYQRTIADCQNGIANDYDQAYYLLGILYENGAGVKKDDAAAISNYEKVSDQYFKKNASHRLKILYYNKFAKLYNSNNYAEALTWCEKAAALGNPDAEKWLPLVRKKVNETKK